MRRNVMAGSIIFTVGDVGAQGLTHWTAVRGRRRRRQRRKIMDNIKDENDTLDNEADSVSSSFRLDQQRLIISTILGAVWGGIVNPAVYTAVERCLPGGSSLSSTSGGFGRVLLKMFMSCSILSTAGNYSTMFFRRWTQHALCHTVSEYYQQATATSTAALSKDKGNYEITTSSSFGETFWRRSRDCITSCNRDFGEVLRDDLKIWPMYDILCYSVIPPPIRPVTTAIMSSLWSMYMSIASAAAADDNDDDNDADLDLIDGK